MLEMRMHTLLRCGEPGTVECQWGAADMHCPELPQEGNNFWRASCLAKQQCIGGACAENECAVGMALSGRKPIRCKCGNKPLHKTRIAEMDFPPGTCEMCGEIIIAQRRVIVMERERKKANEAKKKKLLDLKAERLRQLAEVEIQLSNG